MRLRKCGFMSNNMSFNSKNNDEEDGAFYILESLARNEIKRSNYYDSCNKDIKKDKLAVTKQNECLQKYSSPLVGTDTQSYDFWDEFLEIELTSHGDTGNQESKFQAQRGLEPSLIFISKVKQNKKDEDTPVEKSASNSTHAKCIDNETPKSKMNSKIPIHINNNKTESFNNLSDEFFEECPNNDITPHLNTKSYLNDWNNGCSESCIVIQDINRWSEKTMSECNIKVIKTMLKKNETKSLPKEACLEQNTHSFDKTSESVNLKGVIDHTSFCGNSLKKHRTVEKTNSNDTSPDQQTKDVVTKANHSRKGVTSASECVQYKITHTNVKEAFQGDDSQSEDSLPKTREMNYLKSCHKDYSRMTKDERTRELKRIYGMHLSRKVQHAVQQPEWVF